MTMEKAALFPVKGLRERPAEHPDAEPAEKAVEVPPGSWKNTGHFLGGFE